MILILVGIIFDGLDGPVEIIRRPVELLDTTLLAFPIVRHDQIAIQNNGRRHVALGVGAVPGDMGVRDVAAPVRPQFRPFPDPGRP